MTGAASPAPPEDFLDRIDQQLADTDTFLARCYPGEDARRQPVHTVYVPADRYSADLPWQWRNAAMALVDQHGGIEALCTDLVSDLSFCGLDKPNLVFYAADRPYGLIEATICRAGAPSADQAWMGVAGFC